MRDFIFVHDADEMAAADSSVWGEIEDKVGDELMFEGLDENYEPNQIGRICESILDKIPIFPD